VVVLGLHPVHAQDPETFRYPDRWSPSSAIAKPPRFLLEENEKQPMTPYCRHRCRLIPGIACAASRSRGYQLRQQLQCPPGHRGVPG
jgi:hypothetical protein